MKIINPNAPGRFQGAVEWFRVNTPEDRFNLIGEPGEMLLCEATGESWRWDLALKAWVAPSLQTGVDGATISVPGPLIGGNIRTRFALQRLARRARGTMGVQAFNPNTSALIRIPGPKGKTVLRARLWFRNYATTGSPGVITGVKVSGANAQGGICGAGGTWKTVPFIGGASTLELPLGKEQDPGPAILPSEVCTDWVRLDPIARTDGATYPGGAPLYDWIFRTGAVSFSGIGAYTAPTPETSQFAPGWTNNAADWIATPPTSTPNQTYTCSFVWVEYEILESAKKIGFFGDSQLDGEGPTKKESGFCQLAAYAEGIDYGTFCQGGRTSYNTWEEMWRWLPTLDLDAVVIRPWTVNDLIYSIDVSEVWTRYLAEREKLLNLGYKVLVIGPMPAPAYSTTIQAFIRQKLIDAGHDFFDAGLVVATDATLSAWAGSNSTDGIHPNDTGTPLLFTAFRTWLAGRL